VFLPVPGKHIIYPSTGIDTDADKPLYPSITLGKVIQLLAKRAGNMSDSRSRSRKHVVQAQWVQDCLEGRTRYKYRSGWEIRYVRCLSSSRSVLISRVGKPAASPHHKRNSSPPAGLPFTLMHNVTSLGGSITPQIPSFAIPSEPMTPMPSPACDRSDQSASADAEVWRPTTPTLSTSPGGIVSSQQNVETVSGVFAKGPHEALTFHVLGGSMQKIAEMNIAVSHLLVGVPSRLTA
jgi:hypothetical protein